MATKETKLNTKTSKSTPKASESADSKAKDPSNGTKTDRNAKGQFTAGNKGGGRPKIPDDVKEACRAASMEAIEVLKAVMRDPTESGSTRIKAAEVILDRAWGKPTQAIEMEEIDTTVRIVMDKSMEAYCV